jgi:hypothetical protein
VKESQPLSDNVTTTRKQRLEVLENQLREDGKVVARVRRTLLEIHDDHLYEEIGFKSWEDYLRLRVYDEFGIEMRQAKALVAHVQILDRLPEVCGTQHRDDLPVRVVQEVGRLAPSADGNPKHRDYGRLNRRDAARVVQKAAALAQETETKEVTQSIMRKVVDEELGVKRGPKPKPEPTPEDEEGNLHEILFGYEGRIDGMREALEKNVNEEAWKIFGKQHGNMTLGRLAVAAEKLVRHLRSYVLPLVNVRKRLPSAAASAVDRPQAEPTLVQAALGLVSRMGIEESNEFMRRWNEMKK